MPVLGKRQPEVFAQRRAFVRRAEQPALLQDGQHQFDKVIQPARQPWRQNIKPVGGFILEPLLERICHLFGAADDGEVTAGSGDPLVEFANGEIVFVGDLADQLRARFHSFCHRQRRQRPIEIVLRQIDRPSSQTIEQRNPVGFDNQRGNFAVLFLRFFFRTPNERRDAWHDEHVVRVTAAALARALISR